MAFTKVGDAQPIIKTHKGKSNVNDEETKKALDLARQSVKNIDEASNKIELNKKSEE